MKRVFFFGGVVSETHDIAKRLGFNRGEYVIIIDSQDNRTRGLQDETLFVVGTADARDDYHRIVNEALTRRFTVIYITNDTLRLIEEG